MIRSVLTYGLCCGVCVWQEEELKDAILLVFANKQDQKGALNAAQVRRGGAHVHLQRTVSDGSFTVLLCGRSRRRWRCRP